MDHATSSRLPRPSQQPHTLISPPATPSSSSAPMTAAVGHDADSSNDASGGRVELHLVSPLNYNDDIPPPVINAKRKHTIRRIKAAVRDHWPGKPDVSGIRLIHAGRILRDDEVVGDVVTADGTQAYLHLVVRPDSWTDWSKAPVTPGRRGPRAITPAATATLRPAVDPLEGSSYFALARAADSSSYAAAPLTPMAALQTHAILPDWAKLPESPRVLALLYELYFIRYTYLYAVQVAGIDEAQAASQRRQSEASLGNISSSAHQALSDIEALVFKQPPVVAGSSNEMQQIYERTQILLQAVAECSQLGLATMMTPPTWAFQTSPPLQPQAPAAEPAVPPPTLSELIRIFLPVLFLAIKLAILLYIFTRGQSVTKRTAMCAASAAWIVWEVAAIWRRRQRRARAELRRTQQPQAQQQPAATTRPTSSRRHRRQRTASTTAAAAAWTHPLAPSAPHRRLARSFATNPGKYIAQRLAYLGLESEDRAMGFRPYDDAQAQRWAVAMLQGRAPLPAQRRAQRQQQQVGLLRRLASLPGEALSWVRWLLLEPTTLALPLYLYVLTLFPRLEELRADELRRRDRVLARWWSGRARAWVEERRRERRSEVQAGAENDDAAATTTAHLAEVPRLLLHPYVLRYLKLREDEDGLVTPLDGSEGGAVGGIHVREEIEAQRRAARGGGGLRRRGRRQREAAAAAAEGGPEAPAAASAATVPTPAAGEGEEGRAENEDRPAAGGAAAAAEEEEMATSSTEDEEDEEEVEEEEEVEVDEDMGFF